MVMQYVGNRLQKYNARVKLNAYKNSFLVAPAPLKSWSSMMNGMVPLKFQHREVRVPRWSIATVRGKATSSKVVVVMPRARRDLAVLVP